MIGRNAFVKYDWILNCGQLLFKRRETYSYNFQYCSNHLHNTCQVKRKKKIVVHMLTNSLVAFKLI